MVLVGVGTFVDVGIVAGNGAWVVCKDKVPRA
jgi:hypothetical protein